MATEKIDESLSQDWLINCIRHLNYPYNVSVACFGASHMALQAGLVNEFSRFMARNQIIKNTPTEALGELIKNTQIKQNNGERLTDEEHMILEIPHYVEGLSIYQLTYKFKDLVGTIPALPNMDLAAPFVQSQKLEKLGGIIRYDSFSGVYNQESLTTYFTSIKEAVMDAEMTEPFGLILKSSGHAIYVHIDPVSMNFSVFDVNQIKLVEFSSNSPSDIAKQVYSAMKLQSYSFEDPNLFLPLEDNAFSFEALQALATLQPQPADEEPSFYLTDHPTDNTELAESVFMDELIFPEYMHENADGFIPEYNPQSSFDDCVLFSTEIYGTGLQKAKLHTFDELLKKDPKWIMLNEINTEKAKICDFQGSTWLDIAALTNNNDLAKKLCEEGADVNSLYEEDITPLNRAAQRGNVELGQFLLQQGADPNKAPSSSRTPIFIALLNNYPNMIKLLIDNGANINVQTNDGLTPLMVAVSTNNLENVKLLLSQAALNPNLSMKSGCTPLFIAAQSGFTDIVELLAADKRVLLTTESSMTIEELTKLGQYFHREQAVNDFLFTKFNNKKPTAITLSALEIAALFGHQAVVDKITMMKETKLPLAQQSFFNKKVDLTQAQSLENDIDPNFPKGNL